MRCCRPDRPATCVFEVDGGRFAAVTAGAEAGDARRLPGVVLPGFANAHSHAFHRALRGRTHDGGGTFWTWRERMYAVSAALDPDSYLALATGDLRRDGARRRHDGRRVPLPAPRARWRAATRTRTRWPRRCARPRRTPASGSRCSTRATWPADCRRRAMRRSARSSSASATARSTPGRRGSRRSSRPTRMAVGAAIHSVRAVPRSSARHGARRRRRPPVARPPVRAAGRERGVPGVLRLHADGAARRLRRARPDDDGRARDASHACGHRRPRLVTIRPPASARPPSATSPTASARRVRCAMPGRGSASARTRTP